MNEAFSCTEEEIFTATGEDRYLYRQDKALPIVPACDLLRTRGANELDDQVEKIVLSVNANRRTYALLVDSVLGVQQIVVKKLTGLVTQGDYYSGAALIGDGKIALVIEVDPFCSRYDLGRLADRAHIPGRETQIEEMTHSLTGEHIRETLLLAHIDGGQRVGIPLSLVNRLEKVRAEVVETASGAPAMQYRDSILPIVFANMGMAKDHTHDELDVVICRSGDQPVGLVVEDIIDIVEEDLFLENIGVDPSIRGTSVVLDKVTDILQVDRFLAKRLLQH
ncbi:MAG: chemotaxis protein CheW [Bdellovibrionales bacterium]|nr:chemotaxis protein CheW [Bdellovibrionales bacterium]